MPTDESPERLDRIRPSGPVAVLVNPSALRRLGGGLSQVVAALNGAGRPVRVLAAATRDQALAACAHAVAEGAAALVTIGGDGTVHLAVQAVANRRVGLGIIPAGTGNDFAVAAGLGDDPIAAATRVATALSTGATRAVDLAHVTGSGGQTRWYAGVLAAGFDAAVNDRANRLRGLVRGAVRYQLAILLELARLRPRRYQLLLDGQPLAVDAVVVAIGNSGQYGGGMRVCPGADLSDGQLDVVIGRAMGRATLVRLAPRLRSGSHLGHPLVSMTRASVVEIAGPDQRADLGQVTYADGEELFALPLTVRCVRGALALLG